MAFESEYLDCMPHKIVYTAPSTVVNRYGKITFATVSSTFYGLVQYENRLIRTVNGVEKLSDTQVIMNATGVLHPEGRFALPDSTGSFPVVISIDRLSDEEGQHHVEVSFGNKG